MLVKTSMISLGNSILVSIWSLIMNKVIGSSNPHSDNATVILDWCKGTRRGRKHLHRALQMSDMDRRLDLSLTFDLLHHADCRL
jgi:hypothetical protein